MLDQKRHDWALVIKAIFYDVFTVARIAGNIHVTISGLIGGIIYEQQFHNRHLFIIETTDMWLLTAVYHKSQMITDILLGNTFDEPPERNPL